MAFTDEMASLATEFTTQLGAGAAAEITITRHVQSSFNPVTQARAMVSTDTYDVAPYVRSAARSITVASPAAGGFVRVEMFSYSVTVADLVTAGWVNDGTKPFDENTTITDGDDIFRVHAIERECGEKLLKFLIHRDLGTA